MLSFLKDDETEEFQPPIWERCVRYAIIFVLTTVLFGSLYLGIKFLE